tara:strand:+ start:1204 stop:1458 length:255 start_codon:yes stop_codon:yes gene_type:complete
MRNINPYMVKKGYYISHLHFGELPGDGYKLLDSTIIRGPFKTLDRAKEVFDKDFGDFSSFPNCGEYGINGPEHEPNGYPTIWYT